MKGIFSRGVVNRVSDSIQREFNDSMHQGIEWVSDIKTTISNVRNTKVCKHSVLSGTRSLSLDTKLNYLDICIAEADKLYRLFARGIGSSQEIAEMTARLDSLRDNAEICKKDLHSITTYDDMDLSLATLEMSEINYGDTDNILDLNYDSFMVYFERDFKNNTQRILSGYHSIITNYYLDVRAGNFLSDGFIRQFADELHNLPMNLYSGTLNHEYFWKSVFSYPFIKVYLVGHFLSQVDFYDKYTREKVENTG